MSEIAPDIAHHAALDARMVAAARELRLLQLVSWPATLQQPFLASFARGKPELPKIEYPKLDFSHARRELERIVAEADPDHPLGHYVGESARSWSIAAELLESLGTPRVTEHSVRLFGRPDEPLPGNGPTTREAARHFIAIANEQNFDRLQLQFEVQFASAEPLWKISIDQSHYTLNILP